MRILLSTDIIHAGGAETFVLRLAQALRQVGHESFLFVHYPDRVDQALKQALAPDVPVLSPWLPPGIARLDGLMLRLSLDQSPLSWWLGRWLRHFVRRERIDVVHSHLFTADRVAAASGSPQVTTLHGDYSFYWSEEVAGRRLRILNFAARARRVLGGMRRVVCIHQEQLRFCREEMQLPPERLVHIYNGYAPVLRDAAWTRARLGIPEEALVFVMVARGIPEKGWETVLEAHRQCSEAVYLVLIGHSDYVARLQERYREQPRVFFLGMLPNPADAIQFCDVGLFASELAEALPTVIIEYLSCGKPVLSTPFAECARMIESAGLMLARSRDPQELARAMDELARSPEQRAAYREHAAAAYRKFEMARCVEAYEAVYQEAAQRNCVSPGTVEGVRKRVWNLFDRLLRRLPEGVARLLLRLLYRRKGLRLDSFRNYAGRFFVYEVSGSHLPADSISWVLQPSSFVDTVCAISAWHYRPQPGDVVLDLGAGFGEETLVYSPWVGPSGKVVAVEASPAVFAMLQEVVRLNRLTNVVPVHAALYDQDAPVEFHDANESIAGALVGTGPASWTVEGLQLDSLMRRYGLDRVDLLKCNIEGAERFLIDGWGKLGDGIKRVSISCHDFRYRREGVEFFRTRELIEGFLRARGFEIHSQRTGIEYIDDVVYGTRV